jgi:hypothetical protein
MTDTQTRQWKYRSIPFALARQANAAAAAKKDVAELRKLAAEQGADVAAVTTAAKKLGPDRLATMVAYLLAENVAAADALTAADRPGTFIAAATPSTPAQRAEQQARIRRAYALGQEQARQRRIAQTAHR